MFNEAEKQEIENEIIYLKFILDFHNQEAQKGNLLYNMNEEDSLNHRLDIMERIAELEQNLKNINMEMLFQIRQQAKDFAKLTTDAERMAFIQAQQDVFTQLSPSEKLEHLNAIKQRTEELKNIVQNNTSVLV